MNLKEAVELKEFYSRLSIPHTEVSTVCLHALDLAIRLGEYQKLDPTEASLVMYLKTKCEADKNGKLSYSKATLQALADLEPAPLAVPPPEKGIRK